MNMDNRVARCRRDSNIPIGNVLGQCGQGSMLEEQPYLVLLTLGQD